MMDAPRRISWPALLVLVGGALGVGFVVAWRCMADPAIPFLSAEKPAEWITYPTPWQLTAREVKERRVRFRIGFDLPDRPQTGQVRLRAFRGYTLWVNDARIGGADDLGAAWKTAQLHDVAAALRSGANRIEVEVVHVTGPPALWLVLQTDQTVVKSDARWEARTEGGAWVPVRLADAPMDHPITESSPTIPEGWRRAWPAVLIWLAVAIVAATAGLFWTRGHGRGADESAPTRAEAWVEPVALAIVIALWAALCVNNVCRLPPVVGFDASAHYDYLRFLQTHHRLPLASDGWEMYQPPLYYVISAVLVAIGRSLGWVDADAALPKLVSMASGIAQVILVWCVLRIVFPDRRRARLAGLVLAGAMPMLLFMSQYPSNEVLSVALVTAALVVALRILRDDADGWRSHAMLGVLLGLGMLAKHTAFLAVVVVLTVLSGRVARRGSRRGRRWLAGAGVTALTVLVVAGWFGLRNWTHFRNPLVGNWDPVSGNAWWQDPGAGTSAYYLRFGRSLAEPFHSCLHSYADGIYSTVWGDGMCAGIADERFRPPWHYDLMAVGYALAWLPTALILLGLVVAVVVWVRRPTATWALLAGHGLLVGFAVFYMTLKLPYYAQAKGFYGLTAMACLCALGAWGFDRLSRWLERFGGLLWIPLLVWAINAYASYVVWPVDAQGHYNLGEVFPYQGKPERGIEHFRQALRMDPNLIRAYGRLGGLLGNLGRYAEARQALEDGLARAPDDLELANNLAWLLATCSNQDVRDGARALELARRACDVAAQESPSLLDTLAAAQAETGRFPQAVRTLERAIELAQSRGQRDGLPALRERLARYEAGRPYRLPSP